VQNGVNKISKGTKKQEVFQNMVNLVFVRLIYHYELLSLYIKDLQNSQTCQSESS